MKNKFIMQMIVAVGMLAATVGITMMIVNFDKDGKDKVDVELDLESDIVSTDPKVSASNFIKFNGTMGDISQINQEYFSTYQEETNSDRRMNAYTKVKDAILPDSPLLSGRTLKTIERDTLDFLVFYEITNMKASNPSKVYPLVVNHDENGEIQYEAVDVFLDFTSSQHTFYWPTDMGSDSIITQMKASDDFSNVKVTLVKSGDLWFVYNVEDSEHLLNVRMSTWQGKGKDTVSTDRDLVNEFEMDYNLSGEMEAQ